MNGGALGSFTVKCLVTLLGQPPGTSLALTPAAL